jgi:hypothetical protein
MYTVNEKSFESFTAAVNYAQQMRCDVIESETGIRRWYPASISRKALRMYNERKAAYAAQQSIK